MLLAGLSLALWPALQLARGPGHGASAEQVQVQVGDGLAAVRAGVDNEAVAVAQVLGGRDLSCRGDELAEHGRVLREGLFGGGEVLFWDDQEMLRGLWVDVGKGEDEVILVDAIDGDGSGGNLTEDAVGRGFRGHG